MPKQIKTLDRLKEPGSSRVSPCAKFAKTLWCSLIISLSHLLSAHLGAPQFLLSALRGYRVFWGNFARQRLCSRQKLITACGGCWLVAGFYHFPAPELLCIATANTIYIICSLSLAGSIYMYMRASRVYVLAPFRLSHCALYTIEYTQANSRK